MLNCVKHRQSNILFGVRVPYLGYDCQSLSNKIDGSFSVCRIWPMEDSIFPIRITSIIKSVDAIDSIEVHFRVDTVTVELSEKNATQRTTVAPNMELS
jgi:hypothetical protein